MKTLSLSEQQELCYTISAWNKPRLWVSPGESFKVETEDAATGQIRKEGDRRDRTKIPHANPQSGPIFLTGARPGDTVTVEIEKIEPLLGQGVTSIVSFWYPQSHDVQMIQKFLEQDPAPAQTSICKIRGNDVLFDRFVLPYRPMIGTIGTADPLESRLSTSVTHFGGNMDIPLIKEGTKLYLPCGVEGALLHLGDVHAAQGEGELGGAGVEMPSTITLKLDVIQGSTISQPRLETKDMIFSIAVSKEGRGLEGAIRLALLDLLLWCEKRYSINRWLLFELASLVAEVKLGNLWAAAVGIPKRYLLT